MPNQQRRTILKSVAAMAAWVALPSATALAFPDSSTLGNRWKLLSFGGGGRFIAEKFCSLRPDIVSRHIVAISGIDSLPPNYHARTFGDDSHMKRIASGENLPKLAVATLGWYVGGEYSYEFLSRIRDANGSRKKILGVMNRSFRSIVSERAFEHSFRQEVRLRSILNDLTIVEYKPTWNPDETLTQLVHRSAEMATIHMVAYLTTRGGKA